MGAYVEALLLLLYYNDRPEEKMTLYSEVDKVVGKTHTASS